MATIARGDLCDAGTSLEWMRTDNNALTIPLAVQMALQDCGGSEHLLMRSRALRSAASACDDDPRARLLRL